VIALRKLWGAMAMLIAIALMSAAPARATIRYEVSLANPGRHFFHVTMTIPNVDGFVTVQMPAWNALYEIRDFAYHVTDLRATDASQSPDRVARMDKNTWRIEGQGEVRVEYATYWNEPGPFGTQLDSEHAFINPAMILCYVPERRAEDTSVSFLEATSGWRVAIELPKAAGSGAGMYVAPNYDALVDAPAEIGAFDEVDFQAAGRPIRAVIHGDAVDHAHLTQMLTQIIESETRMMGGPPFQEYMFLFHIGHSFGGGGMEHANCAAIGVESAADLLNVTAHEFFHLWNVKRIRPQTLEPVDYTREIWTPSLWFAEGVTSTYAAFTLVRTGLWSKGEFLADLGDQITQLDSRPARAWQSAEESSIDTWFENYPLYQRPDFSISYYNKGQLLGVALDLTIRDRTDNRASLDDVLRLLNTEYAQKGRFYPDGAGIRTAAEQVIHNAKTDADANLDAFFARYVAGTDDIPFGTLLSLAGLGVEQHGQSRVTLGFSVSRDAAGDGVISDLADAGPAARAGIREGDVLVTLDGAELSGSAARWLRGRSAGETVRVRIRRDGAEREVSFELGEDSQHAYTVAELPHPSERQQRIWKGMLQGTTDAR
jgi:predicted metalloprotease with PDZ domain